MEHREEMIELLRFYGVYHNDILSIVNGIERLLDG